jgi:hypothetical protein
VFKKGEIMNLDLIKQILVVGIGASCFSVATIQKIKEMLKSKKWLYLVAFIVSFGIGEAFTITFTDLNYILGIWVGLCTWVGADALYKTFEEKIFTPFGELDNSEDVIIDRKDEE